MPSNQTFTTSPYTLVDPGAFVTVHTSALDIPSRRGAVLRSDDRGVTLRVTEGAKGRHDTPSASTEFWPWTSVVYVSEAEPRAEERKLLGHITSS